MLKLCSRFCVDPQQIRVCFETKDSENCNEVCQISVTRPGVTFTKTKLTFKVVIYEYCNFIQYRVIIVFEPFFAGFVKLLSQLIAKTFKKVNLIKSLAIFLKVMFTKFSKAYLTLKLSKRENQTEALHHFYLLPKSIYNFVLCL